jgi:ketosteroid isomerase-like protein
MKLKAILPLLLFVTACSPEKPDNANLVEQVRETEQSFSDYAQEAGIEKAFLAFADEDAVLVRNNKVIRGKMEIAEFLGANTLNSAKLSWKPDFIEVSKAGDMAYTYGRYQFTHADSTGVERSSSGIFHTVWKRQDDGSWKFVYD